MRRYATITMVDGAVYTFAQIKGAGNGTQGRGLDIAVHAAEAMRWINLDDVRSIVWTDSEDQQPERCDAYARRGTGHGVCDRPLDGYGYCDQASDHVSFMRRH